jgi:hypothetical protein
LIADKGYDSDAIIAQAARQNMLAQIPPRKHRKQQRAYDRYLYKLRQLVENAFRDLKEWRGIATRYAKRAASFLTAVHIRCLMLWVRISRRHDLVSLPFISTQTIHKRKQMFGLSSHVGRRVVLAALTMLAVSAFTSCS